MRVLGIDCGTEKTGYGLIESDGVRHSLIKAGTIRTSPADPLPVRLVAIAAALRGLVAELHPDSCAVEEVFHAVNTKSALKLAHVRGVVLLSLAEAGLPVGEYSPLEIKMSVVGYGRAEKQQVQMMVRTALRLTENLAEDASDAVAVAICQATHQVSGTRMGLAAKRLSLVSRA